MSLTNAQRQKRFRSKRTIKGLCHCGNPLALKTECVDCAVTTAQYTRKTYRCNWAPGEHEKAELERPLVKKCACCGSKHPQTERGWQGDHDHRTGCYRGFLCQPCNIIIGFIEKERIQAKDHPFQARYLGVII